MNTETINIEYLKKLSACSEGINFVVRNGLEGFPLNRLNEIKGDFNNFKSWLECALKTKREYDSKGNLIKVIYPSGIYHQWEYDSRGNKIKEISSNGDIYQREYDSRGNLIKEISSNGIYHQWEYDYHMNGTLKSISQDGRTVLEVPEF